MTGHKNNEGAHQIMEHDCKEHTIWTNTKHYTTERCVLCDTITKFRWKSFWKRVAGIFN